MFDIPTKTIIVSLWLVSIGYADGRTTSFPDSYSSMNP
jgi:hypothetical protein